MSREDGYREQVSYIVGREQKVLDILRVDDIQPLLRSAVLAGAESAALTLADGLPICAESANKINGSIGRIQTPLTFEGEHVGDLLVTGPKNDEAIAGIAAMLRCAINIVLANNQKRMLTTETHASIVSITYDELVERNRSLAQSEARYRELAAQLDLKVKEKTTELQNAWTVMMQHEKLASVGQLAAGIAHEINNPLGFVMSNLTTLRKYASRLMAMLYWYKEKIAAMSASNTIHNEASAKEREFKVEIIADDLENLFAQSLEGAERVKKIVSDLKSYSHIDEGAADEFVVVEELDRTLSVLSHQMPAGTEVIRKLEPLPKVSGDGALFCQVLTILLQNAFQAVPSGLRLTLSGTLQKDTVEFAVIDNGPGVAPEIRNRIFEPFFTTKPIGSGTGMGLAVAYDCVRKMGGTIRVDDADGGGARFTITLMTRIAHEASL